MFPLVLIALTWTAVTAGPVEYRVVAVGDNIMFECRARDVTYISWDFKSMVAGTDALIYNGRFVKQEYVNKTKVDIDEDNRRSRLLLKKVLMSDAGTYRCMNTGGDHLFSAELTVFDGRPECTLNTSLSVEEMTVIGINCTMCSSGIIVPVIKCYGDVRHRLLANASRSNETCYYDTMPTVASRDIHGSRIECIVTNETNEVGTDHRWISPNITVRYGPHRVTISPKKDPQLRIGHGETLRCSADSNPAAMFQWTVTGKANAGHVGPVYRVDVCKLIYHDIKPPCVFSDIAGQSQPSTMKLTCSAFRSDRSDKESSDNVHIEIEHLHADCELCLNSVSSSLQPTTTTDFSTLTIGAAAGAASLLVVIIVVIVVCLWSCNRRQRLPQPSETKRPGIYTPNNPFYDDAQSADTDHYSELPPGYSGLQSTGAQYAEIDDNAVTETQLDDGDSSVPLPYQKLSPEQRGQPRQPGVYRQLGDAERVDYVAASQQYLDIIDVVDDSSPKLSHRLDVELHAPPPGHEVETDQTGFPEVTKFVGEENQIYSDRKRKLTNRLNKTRAET